MRFIDMFAGMGTARMAFEQAEHTCVYSIEWDKHKRNIYEVIFGNEPEGSDIRRVRADELPKSDCWTAGFPCQDISVAGKQTGFKGHRSSLFFAVTRLIRETPEEDRPSYLLFENVKNFFSVNRGYDFLTALIELDEIGYDCEWQLLNSKHFGVPQNRERVFIVGHLRGRCTRKVFPIDGQSNEYSTVGKSTETAVARTLTCGGHSGGNHSGMTILCDSGQGRSWQERESITPPLRAQGGGNRPGIFVKQIGNVMPTATRDNPNQGRVYDPSGIAPCLNKMEGGGREPFIKVIGRVNSSQDGFVVSTDGISKTLTSGHFNTPKVFNESRIRRLTPRECMRLQGVSDSITDKLIQAGISDTQLYRAAGDAWTVNVGYEIARRMEVHQ